MKVLLSITSLLLWRVESIPIQAQQSGPHKYGSVFPAALAYDAPNNEIHILNNADRDDGTTQCSYHRFDAMTLKRKSHTSFGSSKEVCHDLLADEFNSHIYVAGHSDAGGVLASQERSIWPFAMFAVFEYYGMLLDLTRDGDETQLQGGKILNGEDIFYNLALASDNSTVYTVSLQADPSDDVQDETTNTTVDVASYAMNNPSQIFPLNGRFDIVVEAFGKTDYAVPNGTDSDELGLAFPDPAWECPIKAEAGAKIANVAGILLYEDAVLVAGSTNGYGSGLGIANNAGKTDMDGFVTKIVRKSGELYNNAPQMAGSPGSYRVQSSTGHDEYIHGICRGSDEDIVYLTGSSNGPLTTKASEFDQGSTRAFVVKLNVTNMQTEWVIELGAGPTANATAAPAMGIACAVSHHESMVFVAGNVLQGGTMRLSTTEQSMGGSDVFLAKIKTKSGEVEYVRQIGSAGNEVLAPRGGLILSPENNPILFGQTNGDLYRLRAANETTQNVDYFIAVLDANGTLPEQVIDLELNETESPLESNETLTEQSVEPSTQPTPAPTTPPPAPTQSPTPSPTEAPTEFRPGCNSANCTMHSFEFSAIKLRLEGVGYIDTNASKALEETMVAWYEVHYLLELRRRLKKEDLYLFKTNISYWGGSQQGGGNVMTYNQTVTFESDRDDVDDEYAEALIVEPLMDEENKNDLVMELRGSHETFADLESITGSPAVPDKNRPTNAAGSADMSVFIWIAAGIFGLCICWGIFTAWNLEKKDQTEDFNEKDDIDQPEAPLDSVQIS